MHCVNILFNIPDLHACTVACMCYSGMLSIRTGWKWVHCISLLASNVCMTLSHCYRLVMLLEKLLQGTCTIMRCESTLYCIVLLRGIYLAPHVFIFMQEFDYVFDIELDEGGPTMRKLKLPYNRDSKMPAWILYCNWLMVFIFYPYEADPYVAAENFLSVNNLPSYYLDQVAEFIVQNAGEYHGPSSITAADPFTGKCTCIAIS